MPAAPHCVVHPRRFRTSGSQLMKIQMTRLLRPDCGPPLCLPLRPPAEHGFLFVCWRDARGTLKIEITVALCPRAAAFGGWGVGWAGGWVRGLEPVYLASAFIFPIHFLPCQKTFFGGARCIYSAHPKWSLTRSQGPCSRQAPLAVKLLYATDRSFPLMSA